MSFLLLSADPGLGTAGTLRERAAQIGRRTCVMVAAREPIRLDLEAMLTAHHGNGALMTIAVRSRDPGDGGDVLIAGDDGRVMAVQPSPHPDEALSDLAPAGVYAVAPEALDHVGGGFSDLVTDLLGVLLTWDTPVYVHRLDA